MNNKTDNKVAAPYALIDGKDQSMPAYGSAKLWIMSLDEPGDKYAVSAQFNPKELQIDRAVSWGTPGEGGKGGKKDTPTGVDKEFTGAQGRSLTVELLFDEYEQDTEPGYSVNVADRVRKLEALAQVRTPGGPTEALRRPHKCVVAWGTALSSSEGNKFQCVIESISTKYTMFDRDGKPLRATVTLKLAEADNVDGKTGKKKK